MIRLGMILALSFSSLACAQYYPGMYVPGQLSTQTQDAYGSIYSGARPVSYCMVNDRIGIQQCGLRSRASCEGALQFKSPDWYCERE